MNQNEAAANEIRGQQSLVTKRSTVKLAKMGMLAAISIVLVFFIRFPIFPAVAFLEYDPADISIFIGTFAFGPLAGILLTVVVGVIQGITVSAQSGIYGIIMHILATGSFVVVAGNLYTLNKSRKGAVIALLAGTMTMTVSMFFANLFITPLFMGCPLEVVKSLMPFILSFNVVKAGINSAVTFVIYKRISTLLHK